jgi:hypothetical protein
VDPDAILGFGSQKAKLAYSDKKDSYFMYLKSWIFSLEGSDLLPKLRGAS